MDGDFGNPASTAHMFGWRAAELVETAREQVAALINADVREIVIDENAACGQGPTECRKQRPYAGLVGRATGT